MKAIATAQATGPLTLTLELSCGASPGNPPPATNPPSPPTAGTMELNGDLVGVQLLSPASQWFKRVDQLAVHPLSKQITLAQDPVVAELGRRLQNSFGPTADFGGIPYAVGSGFPLVPINVT